MGRSKKNGGELHVLRKDEHVSGAINQLVGITGMPYWKAKSIVLWRKRKGYGIKVTSVLEPVLE